MVENSSIQDVRPKKSFFEVFVFGFLSSPPFFNDLGNVDRDHNSASRSHKQEWRDICKLLSEARKSRRQRLNRPRRIRERLSWADIWVPNRKPQKKGWKRETGKRSQGSFGEYSSFHTFLVAFGMSEVSRHVDVFSCLMTEKKNSSGV